MGDAACPPATDYPIIRPVFKGRIKSILRVSTAHTKLGRFTACQRTILPCDLTSFRQNKSNISVITCITLCKNKSNTCGCQCLAVGCLTDDKMPKSNGGKNLGKKMYFEMSP